MLFQKETDPVLLQSYQIVNFICYIIVPFSKPAKSVSLSTHNKKVLCLIPN